MPMTSQELAAYYMRMRNHLVGDFPDKTFQLSRDDIKRLRSVRVLPQG
ncbi:hypothetical protein KDL01_25100 [Actinospica durhamensis]|uniref:Uncharacterized protein n=1 Tax=Actinospica durhamensis TaxID=1508375 RepID=A0A941ESM6_9ACTN|nr:hypothetical protein [Actinospica durhamensis]MBR7836581.1 hypothetical protein [Actinospica durhamensis]